MCGVWIAWVFEGVSCGCIYVMLTFLLSHTTAMKVQASDATAQLLKKIGGFQLECRGSIQIKVCPVT